MTKLAVALALPLVLLIGLVASTSFLVVDVKTTDGPRIVVPVPLVLAQIGLAFAPPAARRVELPEEARDYLPVAGRLIEELGRMPDGELVRVESPEEQVLVEKHGRSLRIEVHGRGEEVEVTVPLAAAARLVERAHGGLDVSEVLSALKQATWTDLVQVSSAGEQVRVWIW